MRRIAHVDAFTSAPFCGNSAGVVLDADGLSAATMQSIARELRHSETAFLLQPDGDDHDVRVRFFTPTSEVPMCGHATLATHFARVVVGGCDPKPCVQKSRAGLQRVVFAEDATGLEVTLHQGTPCFQAPVEPDLVARVASALRLPNAALRCDLPVQIVSTGHSKVLVPLSLSDAELDQLTPDMGALAELSKALGCNGYFVFRLGPDARRSDGRMFAPAIGIEEDPVTGNANGPLGAYLALHGVLTGSGEVELDGHQGRAIGRPGRVRVRVQLDQTGAPCQVSIAGRAVLIAQGELACC